MNKDYGYLSRYNTAQYELDFLRIFEDNRAQLNAAIDKKIQYYSETFIGKPLLNGALGEGVDGQFDQSPLFRSDAFDCVTFVNTVLAMCLAANYYEFKERLLQLSYRNAVCRYQYRHHFISVDWNIENARAGFIADITESIVDESANPIADIACAFIDKPNWLLKRGPQDIKQLDHLGKKQMENLLQALHSLAHSSQGIYAATPYLPLYRLFHIDGKANKIFFEQIPSGTIVEIVRPNWSLGDTIGTHLNISHLGFVVRREGELIFRHASQLEKKVMDIPLEQYLQRYLDSPTVKGINLQRICHQEHSECERQ